MLNDKLAKSNRKFLDRLMLVVAFILFIVAPAVDVMACEGDQGHGYVSLGVGKAGTWLNSNPEEQDKWEDDGGNHALIKLGYRHPIVGNWLWVVPEVGHHSTYNKSPPEPELDYVVISIEARLIP